MSVVLMIYARKAFKTYVLPSIHNADYSIVLNKIIYGLENHVELKLEVGDIYWRFVEDKEVVIRKRDELYYDTNLQNGDILEIENGADLTASVIVTMTDSLFHSYQKLDISRISEITIGKDESNIICYNSLDYISRNHAKLSRLGNEFEVIDTSSNGIFVNSKRVNGRQTLAYGDSIEIFGLNVLYYEDFIAVSNIGGELIINHNLISKHQQLESTVCLSDPKKKSQKFFFRSPRTVLKLFREKVEIEQPPAQNNAKEKPILYTIGPSFTMVLPMLLGTSMSFIGQRGSGASRSIMMFTGIIL